MERIKDLSKLIIQDDMVLIKIKEKTNSGLVLTDQKGPEIEYSTIVLKGKSEKCNRFKEGDIVLQMSNMTIEVHDYKGESYALVPEFTLKLVVGADNFDKDYVKPIKSSLTIN
jgi:co-chaperonin GroES (HSP10)